MPTSLTPDQALRIVEAFDQAGLFERPFPTTHEEYIIVATEILGSAFRAKNAGLDKDVINKVIAIADGSEPTTRLYETSSPHPPDVEPGDTPPWDASDLTNVVPAEDNTDTTHSSLPTDVPPPTETIAAEEGMAAASTDATPLESDQEKEPSSPITTSIPRDFSKVSDAELRSLHATLHGDFAEITHELGLEEADYESAQVNLDMAQKIAMTTAEGANVTAKRTAAGTTSEVLDWREKVDSHHRKVILYRRYKEIIEWQIKGLSREYTMRTGERVATP